MKRTLVVLLFVAFLFTVLGQEYEPLGTIKCSINDCSRKQHLVWVHVIAHFKDHQTIRGLDTWLCYEHYEEMIAE